MNNGIAKKSNIFLAIIVVILFFVLLILLFKDNSKEQFFLIGSKDMIISREVNFNDPGFVAKDKNGNNRNSEVIVNTNLDINTCGNYKVEYRWNDKILLRNIQVYCPDDFSLKGNKYVYVLKNGSYKDEGYNALFNNKNYQNEVVVTSNVNYKKEGLYKIEYSIKSLNKKITRNVYVFDAEDKFEITYDNEKSQKVSLKINFDKDYIFYYVNPSNKKIYSASSNYTITKNGSYAFTIYDKYGNKATQKIEIKNIDSENISASCVAKISSNKTIVTVNASSNVNKYEYNGITSDNNTYTFNSKVTSVKVKVYDKYGDYITVTCKNTYASSKMEIHFIASDQSDDAILIRTDNKTIMIDGGSIYTKKYVLNYLHDLGVTKIDAMIGSHMHSDHIQTQGYILEEFTVDKIYYPDDIFTCTTLKTGSCNEHDIEVILPAIKKYNKQPKVLKAGDKLSIGDINIYFLAPWALQTGSNKQNINSFVFVLTFGSNSFMFTGDTTDTILYDSKLKNYASSLNIPLKVDMFKWPHHGTRALNNNFITTISPEYVVVPNMATGKPESTTASNFEKNGATIYQQLKFGNIVLISDGTNIQVVTNAKASSYKR